MPRSQTGNYTLPDGYRATTGDPVLPSQHNPPLEDIQEALTRSLPRDGSAGMVGNLPMGGYRVTDQANAINPQDSVTKAQLDALAALVASAIMPSGAVQAFAMVTPPNGWLKCNGAEATRTGVTAQLFAAIGTTFGVGNGTTTFNVPDLRGVFARGFDDGRSIDASRVFGSQQASQNLLHNHTASNVITDPGHLHGYQAVRYQGALNGLRGGFDYLTVDAAQSTARATTGIDVQTTVVASGGNESRPVNVSLLYCIKI